MIRYHHGHPHIFEMQDSQLAVQQGYMLKVGNAVTFHNVAPVQLHHKNCERPCAADNT